MTVLKLVDPIYTILMEFESLRELLETLYDRYNPAFILADIKALSVCLAGVVERKQICHRTGQRAASFRGA